LSFVFRKLSSARDLVNYQRNRWWGLRLYGLRTSACFSGHLYETLYNNWKFLAQNTQHPRISMLNFEIYYGQCLQTFILDTAYSPSQTSATPTLLRPYT